MRKNHLWNRIFFKKEIRNNMKDAELQLTLSNNGARIIKAVEKCDSLYELMEIHKEAWAIGFQNVYLGPDRYGIFRTESIPTMRPEEVFLGNIWGLSTHTIPFWEERKSQLYGCNGFGIDPETSLYDIILGQYKKLLDFNLVQIWNKAVISSITYKKTGYLK